MTTFERWVDVHPGHALLGDYGIAACRVFFYVRGTKGAVQFQIGTDWYPKKAREHLAKFPADSLIDRPQPQGWDIGYHSHKPHYEHHKPISEKCPILNGLCYYDGSSLQADDWVEGFVCGGTEWLWPRLEQYYRFTFESGEYPDITPTPREVPKR